MAAPIYCISARRQNWRNGSKLEQFKAMDRLISRCEVRQCSQMQPGVRVREKRRSCCYPVFTLHIILFLLLPTKFLRASSASHRAPTGPSHTQGRTDLSEPLRNERRWHINNPSEEYSVISSNIISVHRYWIYKGNYTFKINQPCVYVWSHVLIQTLLHTMVCVLW